VKTIASLDIGRKNLAVFVYDAERRQGTFWQNYNLGVAAKYDVRAYHSRVAAVLQNIPRVDVFVVERQNPMAPRNCYLEMAIHCFAEYALKTRVVSADPKVVAQFFRLNVSSPHFKKRDAVHVCAQVLMCRRAAIQLADPALTAQFLTEERNYGPRRKHSSTLKLDDLSDCLLQAVHYAETQTLFKSSAFSPNAYTHYSGKCNQPPLEKNCNDANTTKRKLGSKRAPTPLTAISTSLSDDNDDDATDTSSDDENINVEEQTKTLKDDDDDDDDEFLFRHYTQQKKAPRQ